MASSKYIQYSKIASSILRKIQSALPAASQKSQTNSMSKSAKASQDHHVNVRLSKSKLAKVSQTETNTGSA